MCEIIKGLVVTFTINYVEDFTWQIFNLLTLENN